MAIKIQRLVCNVTVVPSAGAAASSINRNTSETTSVESSNATTISAAHAESTGENVESHGASTAAIDPRAVADRVYRLMRDELSVDRERE